MDTDEQIQKISRKTIFKWSLAKAVLLFTGFCEGFTRYPLDALLFYYLRVETNLRIEDAKALYHVQLCVYCYTMMAVPSIIPRRSSIYLINFITTVLIMVCFVLFAALSNDDRSMPPNRPGFFNELSGSEQALIHGKFTLVILVSVFNGARSHIVRHLLEQQYHLPLETESFERFRLQRGKLMAVGKIVGLLTCTYFGKSSGDVVMKFVTVFYILAIVTTLDCGMLFVGFSSDALQVKKPIPQGLLRFIRLQRLVLWQKFRKNKPEDDAQRRAQTEEEWTALFKVFPLFIPAVVVIAYRDQRFSVYQQQAEELDPRVGQKEIGFIELPHVILPVLYPTIRLIGAFVFDDHIAQYSLRKGKPVSTVHRSIGGFVFVTLSLAAATILQCHVEKTKIPSIADGESLLLFYNGFECPTKIGIDGLEEFQVPPLAHIKVMLNDTKKRFRGMKMFTECKNVNYQMDTTAHIDRGELNEYFLFYNLQKKDLDYLKMGRRSFLDVYNIHTVMSLIFSLPTGYIVTVESHGTVNRSTPFEKKVFFMNDTNHYANLNLPPDKFSFNVDNITLLETNIGYGSATTFMAINYDLTGRFIAETKLFTVIPPNTISVLYQLPQIIFMGFSDILMESSTFKYASNAVPQKWWNLIYELWLSCGGTGNLVTAMAVWATGVHRTVIVFLFGFGSCWMSVTVLAQLYASVYTENYDVKARLAVHTQ